MSVLKKYEIRSFYCWYVIYIPAAYAYSTNQLPAHMGQHCWTCFSTNQCLLFVIHASKSILQAKYRPIYDQNTDYLQYKISKIKSI